MNKYTKIFLFLLLGLVFANDAFANITASQLMSNMGVTSLGTGTAACKAYNCFFGSMLSLVFSALSIFVLGMAAFMGRIQWVTAIVTVSGVVLLSLAMSIPTSWNLLPHQGVDTWIGNAAWGKGCNDQISC